MGINTKDIGILYDLLETLGNLGITPEIDKLYVCGTSNEKKVIYIDRGNGEEDA